MAPGATRAAPAIRREFPNPLRGRGCSVTICGMTDVIGDATSEDHRPIDTSPDQQAELQERSWEAFRSGRRSEARSILEQGLAELGQQPEILIQLSFLAEIDDNYGYSYETLRRAMSAAPNSPKYAPKYIRQLDSLNRQAEAIQFFDHLPEDVKNDNRVQAAMGDLCVRMGYHARATTHFRKTSNLPTDDSPYNPPRRSWWLSGGPLNFLRRRIEQLEIDAEFFGRIDAVPERKALIAVGERHGIQFAEVVAWEMDSYIRRREVHEHRAGLLSNIWALAMRVCGVALTMITLIAVTASGTVAVNGIAKQPTIALATILGASLHIAAIIAFLRATRKTDGRVSSSLAFALSSVGIAGSASIYAVGTPGSWMRGIAAVLLVVPISLSIQALALRILTTVTYLLRRSPGRNDAILSILHAITQALVLVQRLEKGDNRLGRTYPLWAHMEQAAVAVERGVVRAIPFEDEHNLTWAAERGRGASRSIRNAKRYTGLTSGRNRRKAENILERSLCAFIAGNVRSLPYLAAQDFEPRRRRLVRIALHILRTVLIAAFPIAAVFALPAMNVSGDIVTAAKVLAIIWGVLTILHAVDPKMRERLEMARGVAGDLRPASDPLSKQAGPHSTYP